MTQLFFILQLSREKGLAKSPPLRLTPWEGWARPILLLGIDLPVRFLVMKLRDEAAALFLRFLGAEEELCVRGLFLPFLMKVKKSYCPPPFISVMVPNSRFRSIGRRSFLLISLVPMQNSWGGVDDGELKVLIHAFTPLQTRKRARFGSQFA